MADFCKQCSTEIFGQDHGDLSRLMAESEYSQFVGAVALCEGCGPTVVDIHGRCIGIYCDKRHGVADEAV